MIIDAVLRMQPDGFDALMQLLEEVGCRIKRGAQISIKPPEGERYIRLDTLGQEYDEASLRRTLARDHVHIPKIPREIILKIRSSDWWISKQSSALAREKVIKSGPSETTSMRKRRW